MLTYVLLIALFSFLLFFINKYEIGYLLLPIINIALIFGLCSTILSGLVKLVIFIFKIDFNSEQLSLYAVLILLYIWIWIYSSITYKIVIPKGFEKGYIAILYGVPNAPKFSPVPFLYPKVIKIKIPNDGIYRTSYKYDHDFFYRKTSVYWNKVKVYDSKVDFEKVVHHGKYKQFRYTLMFLSDEQRELYDIDKIFNTD